VTQIHSVFKPTAHFQSSMSCPRVESLENHDCSPVVRHNNAPCLTWELQGVIMVLFFHCSFDGMLMAKNQELR